MEDAVESINAAGMAKYISLKIWEKKIFFSSSQRKSETGKFYKLDDYILSYYSIPSIEIIASPWPTILKSLQYPVCQQDTKTYDIDVCVWCNFSSFEGNVRK